ncbi:hypothetical protein CCR75_004629 [Bremia lactucae]|uniref:Uncharacterized protein n=1 Tax=Bremia lactucae TaxID=4779 RepID=A0A976IM74_BRELC|nr:hypothetical protein CCR75_004629 [Bremia lactucae]
MKRAESKHPVWEQELLAILVVSVPSGSYVYSGLITSIEMLLIQKTTNRRVAR